MIRVGFECLVVFLLPAVLYFGFVLLMADPAIGGDQAKTWAGRLDAAPLPWLFGLGVVCLVGTLMVLATLSDDALDHPYSPAVFKNGQIVKGGSR